MPFIDVTVVQADQFCPQTHPALVAFDIWPGLNQMCYCNNESDLETVYGEGCTGDRRATTKCTGRPAIPTLYLPVLNGYKVCGKRGGKAFREAQRPVVGSDGGNL